MTRINSLNTMDGLNRLAEQASNDDRITNDDYVRIYDAALRRVNEASSGGREGAVQEYRDRINRVRTLNGLNRIGAQAQRDGRITNDDYVRLMNEGIERVNAADNARRRRRR